MHGSGIAAYTAAMLERQTKLPLDFFQPLETDPPTDERLPRYLAFMSAGIATILDSLPVPRRALSESTKALHLRVTLERRNGYCPCCQQVPVCTAEGKLPCAQFDHFYSRNRAAPDETWLICASCNRELENTHFKASVQSCFRAYSSAVFVYMAEQQSRLFD